VTARVPTEASGAFPEPLRNSDVGEVCSNLKRRLNAEVSEYEAHAAECRKMAAQIRRVVNPSRKCEFQLMGRAAY